MEKQKFQRKTLIINRDVQLKIIGFGSISALGGTLFAAYIARVTFPFMLAGEEVPRQSLLMVGLAGLLLFSVATIIGMYLSNRIAGPIHRVHRGIKAMADGETPERIRGRRPGDSYQSLIEDYNRMVDRLDQGGSPS